MPILKFKPYRIYPVMDYWEAEVLPGATLEDALRVAQKYSKMLRTPVKFTYEDKTYACE